MTISNTDDPVAGPFEGDDTQTVFPFTFKVFAESDLEVVASISGVESTLTLDSDYSVFLNADQNANPGGSISYPLSGSPLTIGDTLTAASALSYTQPTSIANASGFYPKVIENALDRCVMLIKQASAGLSRSLRFPLSDAGINTELPSATARALKTLTFDADGDPVCTLPADGTIGAFGADLLDSSAANNGGGMVGHGLATDYEGIPGAPVNTSQAIQEMLGAHVFTMYVATTGSDSNDGSISAPFRTLQKAFNALMGLGTVGGTRRIILGAGTWSGASNRSARIGPANATETVPNTNYQADGVSSSNYVIVEGADVGYNPASSPQPVPTTIFDGGAAAAFGIQAEGPVKLLVKSIKFKNYNGSSSSAGVSGDGSFIRCENVHGDNNNMDISSSRGRLEVKGGLLNGATLYAIRSIFLNKHEIGSQAAGAVGQGPFISNANIGLLAQEGATGHSDYVTYADCVDAIRATVNSRVNFTGSEFARCTRGVRADANAVIFHSSANFNDGTADACTENVVIQQGAVDVSRDAYANSGLAVAYLNATVDHTGTLTSTARLSYTLSRGLFCPNISSIRKPQHIRFHAFGTMTGTAATKQFKLRLGSTVLAVVTNAAADTGSWEVSGTVAFQDSNVQAANITYVCHLTSTRVNTDTGTEDLAAADGTLTFEVQLGDVNDHIIINHAHLEVWG